MSHGQFGWISAAMLSPLLASTSLGEEARIRLDRLPVEVRRAADRALPGVRWAEAIRVAEGGAVNYELSGADAEGDDVGVTVTASGRVTEVEREVAMAEVPKVARAALRGRMPAFKPEGAMEVIRGNKVVGFTFEGKLGGAAAEVFVSADGKTVEEED